MNNDATALAKLLNKQVEENQKLKLRRKKLGVTIAGIFVYPLVTAVNSFFIMLGLGAAHDQWPTIPALGYWTTYLIAMAVACLSGAIHGGNRIKFKKEEI